MVQPHAPWGLTPTNTTGPRKSTPGQHRGRLSPKSQPWAAATAAGVRNSSQTSTYHSHIGGPATPAYTGYPTRISNPTYGRQKNPGEGTHPRPESGGDSSTAIDGVRAFPAMAPAPRVRDTRASCPGALGVAMLGHLGRSTRRAARQGCYLLPHPKYSPNTTDGRDKHRGPVRSGRPPKPPRPKPTAPVTGPRPPPRYCTQEAQAEHQPKQKNRQGQL